MTDEEDKILSWASADGGVDIARLHFCPDAPALADDLVSSGLLVREGTIVRTTELGRAARASCVES